MDDQIWVYVCRCQPAIPARYLCHSGEGYGYFALAVFRPMDRLYPAVPLEQGYKEEDQGKGDRPPGLDEPESIGRERLQERGTRCCIVVNDPDKFPVDRHPRDCMG